MGDVSANEQLKQILRAGKLFEGKYRIQRPLGAGSFAVVVQAMHEVMGREVALKFLKPKVVEGNPEVADRFIKEVQIASKLKHPNVVTIFDFGKTEDGIYYMVQEFIDGVTLDEVLLEAPGRRLPRERVLDQVRQVLSCLDQAHKLGIIHRDLKPSNLMSMQREGREVIKVLDFGVAKLLEQDGPSSGGSRQSTKFIGTPIYMSPEQILGLEVHGASDLYSIGLMLYELLTGDAPIHAQQVAEVVQQHLSPQAFAFPLLPTLEPAIQRTILKATARYPEDRFRTARDFLAALDGELVEDEASSTAERPAAAYVVTDDKTEEEDLEAFLGRNYIALDAQLPQDSAFEPVRPAARPVPELRPQGAPPPDPRRRTALACAP